MAAPDGQGGSAAQGSAASAGTLAALYGVGSRLREYGSSSFANVSRGDRGGCGGTATQAVGCSSPLRSSSSGAARMRASDALRRWQPRTAAHAALAVGAPVLMQSP